MTVTEWTTAPLPPLRGAVEILPIQDGDQRLFCLRDRLDPAARPLVVSEAALHLVALLDGERTVGAVRAAFLLRTGARLPEAQIAEFVRRLDQASLLDSRRYRREAEERRAAFRAAPLREAIHAGAAYPGGEGELRAFLDGLYDAPNGPGERPGRPRRPPARGLIAPHIDLHRGGPTYAWTYRALAECEPADLYVLLGTCHTPMTTPLAATRKPYGTPFGPAEADDGFISALEAAYPGDLYADEFSHRAEHSLEFQAVYLRHLDHVGGAARPRIVPLLCGSFHQWVGPEESPLSAPEVRAAIGALRATLDTWPGRVCLVAGADLAHVGPQFGDERRVDSRFAAAVERADREMLEIIGRGDAEGFYRQVMRDRDGRRICGLSPIYYLLSLLGPADGRLVKYSQWTDQRGHGSVTYAGVIFEP